MGTRWIEKIVNIKSTVEKIKKLKLLRRISVKTQMSNVNKWVENHKSPRVFIWSKNDLTPRQTNSNSYNIDEVTTVMITLLQTCMKLMPFCEGRSNDKLKHLS